MCIGGRGTDLAQGRFAVACDGNIAHGDDTKHLSLLHDRKATDRLFSKEAHGIADARRRENRRELATADLANRDVGGVTSLRQHPHHNVAVGQDTVQLVILQDHHVADIVVPHDLGRVHHGGRGLQSSR